MRIRKRWPLTSLLPPFASAPNPTYDFPSRNPSSSVPSPSDQQAQVQNGEDKAKAEEDESEGRSRMTGLEQQLHPNGEDSHGHLLRNYGSKCLIPPSSNTRRRSAWIGSGECTPHQHQLDSTEGKQQPQEFHSDEKYPEAQTSVVGANENGDSGVLGTTGNMSRSFSVEAAARLLLPSLPSRQGSRRLFSIKKKRGPRGSLGLLAAGKKKEKAKSFLDEREDREDKEFSETEGGLGRKKRRSNNSASDAMEGSRCSRINGRGWRCSQKTLVGYALCEHHLGKGRLRSMSHFPGGEIAARKSNLAGERNGNGSCNSALPLSLVAQNDDAGDEEDDHDFGRKEEDEEAEDATAETADRRKEIGRVKARSISSLLEANHSPTHTLRYY